MDPLALIMIILLYGSMAVIAIAAYVLSCLGLYTVAKRRGIDKPWLVWLPIGNVWIIGSISDQYQQQVKNKQTKRRKLLLGMDVAGYVLTAVYIVFVTIMVVALVTTTASAAFDNFAYDDYSYNDHYESFGADAELAIIGTGAAMYLGVFAFSGVMSILACVESVFLYISYFDLFASCEPDKAVLFLLLSIFIPIACPVLLFLCRKKDDGFCLPEVEQLPETEN